MSWRKIDIQKLSRYYPANVADVENVNNNAIEEVQKVCNRYNFTECHSVKPVHNLNDIISTLKRNKITSSLDLKVILPFFVIDHAEWLRDASGKIFLLSRIYNIKAEIPKDLKEYIHEDFIGYEILEENTYFPSKNTVSLLLFNKNIQTERK